MMLNVSYAEFLKPITVSVRQISDFNRLEVPHSSIIKCILMAAFCYGIVRVFDFLDSYMM
jgi:hypothetical protein